MQYIIINILHGKLLQRRLSIVVVFTLWVRETGVRFPQSPTFLGSRFRALLILENKRVYCRARRRFLLFSTNFQFESMRLERIWELFVCALSFSLIVGVWYTSMFLVFKPWAEITFRMYRSQWIIYLTVTNIFSVSSIVSFLAASLTSPGTVRLKDCLVVTMPWCVKCDAPKPERSHHCSQCRTCVLKMDHHCPWIGNCVGFWNHGHFVRFIIFTWISAVLVEAGLSLRLYGTFLVHLDGRLDAKVFFEPNLLSL